MIDYGFSLENNMYDDADIVLLHDDYIDISADDENQEKSLLEFICGINHILRH